MPRQLYFVMMVIWVWQEPILVTTAIFDGFSRLWKVFVTIPSTDNGRDSLVATSLSKSMSPSASRFSGAKSGLASQS